MEAAGMKSVAVLMDAGYVRKRLKRAGKLINVEAIREAGLKCVNQDEELFRIFYYDCFPYEGKSRHPVTKEEHDFSETPVYKAGTAVLGKLARQETFALRKGKLSFGGWRLSNKALKEITAGRREYRPDDLEPSFKQKGVDIRIGLDIASLATKRIVDKVVLVAKDSDFSAAMKFARREGVTVVIVSIGEDSLPELEEHADEIRTIDP